ASGRQLAALRCTDRRSDTLSHTEPEVRSAACPDSGLPRPLLRTSRTRTWTSRTCMRDRSLFAVVLAFVAGVVLWPSGASRRAEAPAPAGQGIAAPAPGAPSGTGAQGSQVGGAGSARHGVTRHGAPHPHVSQAMLLLLAEYLALDPHPEAPAHRHAQTAASRETAATRETAPHETAALRETAAAREAGSP